MMRTILLLMLLFSSMIIPSTASADIENDIRQLIKKYSNQVCIAEITKIYSENHEIMVLILGDRFVDENFRPQSAKQLKFKSLLDQQDSKIQKYDLPIILQIFDLKNHPECRFDHTNFSDPFLKSSIQDGVEAINNMIHHVKNNNATYADVSLLLKRENTKQQELILHLLKEENLFENKIIMSEFMKFNKDMIETVQPMFNTLLREYDLRFR